jgi:hypothetical protein
MNSVCAAQAYYLAVSHSNTEAGEGRTIPLNSALYDALAAYADWYILRFGELRPEWYVSRLGGLARMIRHDPSLR